MPTRGRKPKYQELLGVLGDATGLSTPDLAKALGKDPTVLARHISGAKVTDLSFIASGLRHLAEWRVVVHAEVEALPANLAGVPSDPGIYALFTSAGDTLYVGQAINLQFELRQTLGRRSNFPVRFGPSLSKKGRPRLSTLATHYSAYVVPSKRLRHNLEALLLRIYPNHGVNNKLGVFK